MADKNVLLHDSNGDNLFPQTKQANIVDFEGVIDAVNGYGGYVKFPGGLMIQYGSLGGYVGAKRDNLTVDMPLPFINNEYAVFVTGYYYSQPEAYETAGTSHVETVQRFTLHRFNTTSNYLNSMKWMAIGRWK